MSNELGRQLATLTYAHVQPSGPGEAMAAAVWWNVLARLGLSAPLFVLHDLGLLLTRGERGRAGVAHLAGGAPLFSRYEALLSGVAASGVAEELGQAPMRDEVVGVVLARVLGDVFHKWPGRPRATSTFEELPLGVPTYAEDRQALAGRFDPAWVVPYVQLLVDQQAAVLTRVEQVETAALRLLGLFSREGRALDLADLHQLAFAVGAADVVDFSLQLLPSLLETKRHASTQLFSVDGYASIERRGHLDSILPSELAHEGEAFEQKAVFDDFLYYGHERQREGGRVVNYVLVDASASMRGAREVFARGLALALTKKLALLGREVWLRFFDSRLHERVEAGRGGRELPYVLSFRSERGRHYERVFEQLLSEVTAMRRDEGREVAITFITHAECHVSASTMEALARQAHLYGVFVLPGKPVRLPYLQHLRKHQIVTAETLARGADKRRRALEIVDDVTAAPPVDAASGA